MRRALTVLALLLTVSAAASGGRPVKIVQESSAVKARFALEPGANLRILDDNIWDYSKETIPEAWQKLGVDCRDAVRGPQFAGMVQDYSPDVFGFQEYSRHMHDVFYPLVKQQGYEIAYESGADWNNTPLFYRPESVELLDVNYVLYTPKQWSNGGSKSFTSAVFRLKSNGRLFGTICTHLWWKSDTAQPGSTLARASQVRLMMAEAEVLRAKYPDLPIFVMGDMNCEEATEPMQQFLDGGYVPCYKAATVSSDDHNGHHICSPGDGFSAESRRKGADRQTGAIDHLLISDPAGSAEVRVFGCIMDEYTIKLTDHYPNYLDIKL